MLKIKEYREEIKRYAAFGLEELKKINNCSILITGAAGLIGSYLVDMIMVFNEEYGGNIIVYALDRNEEELNKKFYFYENCKLLKLLKYDVINAFSEIKNIKFDFVIHAASNTSPLDYANDPVGTMTANIIGLHEILEYAKRNGTRRVLFCSSVEIYGQRNDCLDDFNELDSGYVDCNTVRAGYPSSKRAAESMCAAYRSQFGIDYVIARIGRIYGATIYLNDTKAPTQFIMNAVKNESIVLKSDGKQIYSYGYVGDCALAIFTVLVKGKSGEAYNISDPDSKIQLKDFALYAAEASGTELVFKSQNVSEQKGYSQITKATMNVQKLLALGWEAHVHPKEGILRTIAYIKDIIKDGKNNA